MSGRHEDDLLARWREAASEPPAPKVLSPKTEREWEEQVSGRLTPEHPLGPAPYGDLGARPY